MAQTLVLGADGITKQGIDPTFLAARIALKPLEYAAKGRVLGHYSTFQRSGEIAATLGAASALASIRWPDTTAFAVLLRLKLGVSVSAAVTSGYLEQAYKATIHRGFTVDYTAANTRLNMTSVPNTNAMRKTMGSSLMGTTGPAICTTAVMTGNTSTADTTPFAGCTLPSLILPVTATGTAALLPQGTASPMTTAYECTSPYQHPVVLSALEGVVVQNILALYATGTFALYTQWEWAEVDVF